MELVKKKYEESMQVLAPAFKGMPWETPGSYQLWLAQVYYIVRHSTRLLAFCSARCPFDRDNLHKRFIKHAGEEMGHEVLAKRDLNFLGHRPEDFSELKTTAALVSYQYESIADVSAVSFFGYILLLEGLAITVGKELCNRITTSYGAKATSFLRVHIEEDEDHVSQAFESMATFTDSEVTKIVENLQTSTTLYQAMLGEILAKFETFRAAMPLGKVSEASANSAALQP